MVTAEKKKTVLFYSFSVFYTSWQWLLVLHELPLDRITVSEHKELNATSFGSSHSDYFNFLYGVTGLWEKRCEASNLEKYDTGQIRNAQRELVRQLKWLMVLAIKLDPPSSTWRENQLLSSDFQKCTTVGTCVLCLYPH